MSTANSVRCTAAWSEALSDASGCVCAADAIAFGAGESSAFATTGFSGSISFWAPGSGGASMDLAAIKGVAGVGGVAAGAVGAGGAGEAIAGLCSIGLASVRGRPIFGAGSGFGAGSDLAKTVVAGATVDVTGATAGATGCVGEDASVEGLAAASCVGAVAEFCRAIAPVTESSPCSSTVTREYSRSRSLLSVSIADASRRVSFWLSRVNA
jgi:hypothetical protein